MKRIVPVLLSLLLLAGCLLIPGPGPLAENAGPTPAPADGPQVTGPFLSYRFFEQEGWENRTSGVMFEADLDQDGVAEPVSFALRTDDWATAITWGVMTRSSNLMAWVLGHPVSTSVQGPRSMHRPSSPVSSRRSSATLTR